jgi:AcrR family transcriptional regulator
MPTTTTTTDAPQGLRARKKAATARAIEAAVEHFIQSGEPDWTVNDITDHAGMSQRTFFRYFSSKDEAVLAACGITATDWDEATTNTALLRQAFNQDPALMGALVVALSGGRPELLVVGATAAQRMLTGP